MAGAWGINLGPCKEIRQNQLRLWAIEAEDRLTAQRQKVRKKLDQQLHGGRRELTKRRVRNVGKTRGT